MAIIGITLAEVVAHQSDADPDKGKDGATTFRLGTLDSRVMGRLKDEATSFSVDANNPDEAVDVSIGQNDLYYLSCRFGLKGWDNFKDKDGNDIPFKTSKKNYAGRSYDAVSDECLARLPQPVIAELGRKIIELNEVTVTEAKN